MLQGYHISKMLINLAICVTRLIIYLWKKKWKEKEISYKQQTNERTKYNAYNVAKSN